MYTYLISNNEYSDREDRYLFHEEKFTCAQFIEKYNFAIDYLNSNEDLKKNKNWTESEIDVIARIMCDMFQFKQLDEPLFTIHSLNPTRMEKVNLNGVEETNDYICTGE